MKIKTYWKYIALFLGGVLLSLILFTKKPEIVIETEYIYDTAVVKVPVEVPVPYQVVTNQFVTDTLFLWKYVYDTIPVDVDTAAILADYFKTIQYRDTIVNDDIDIFLNEDITQNRIAYRDLSYVWKRPTEISTTNYFGNYIYLGITPYYAADGLNAYGHITYAGKKWMGTAGYDPFQERIFVGAGYRIIRWKSK